MQQLLTAGASFVAEYGLSGAWAPGIAACGLGNRGSWVESTGSVVVAHGLSCSEECGILPDKEADLCLLHCLVTGNLRYH